MRSQFVALLTLSMMLAQPAGASALVTNESPRASLGPCGIWSEGSTPNHPSARASSAAIYDPIRMRTILFGGYVTYLGGAEVDYNDVWQHTAAAGWSQLAPTGTPPPPTRGARPSTMQCATGCCS